MLLCGRMNARVLLPASPRPPCFAGSAVLTRLIYGPGMGRRQIWTCNEGLERGMQTPHLSLPAPTHTWPPPTPVSPSPGTGWLLGLQSLALCSW